MQLRIEQENAGTPVRRMLNPNSPQTIRLDWARPPLEQDASEDEWQQWHERQNEETLGISSYSSVYSFLYIDDYEVRHEILIPLVTLDESLRIARADDAFLEVEEQDAVRDRIEAFFTTGNPVEIDGVQVKPVVKRLDFYGLDFKDLARRAERGRVSMASGRVGIILSYGTKGPPTTAKITWDRFNRFIWSVNMIVYAYDETIALMLSRIGMENTYQWSNPGRSPAPGLQRVDVSLPPRPILSLPVISLFCLALLPVAVIVLIRRRAAKRTILPATGLLLLFGVAGWPIWRWEVPNPLVPPPQISDEQAEAIFAALHKNIYRAFDYHDESHVYDALANSVDGSLLRELYLKIRHGLEMREQSGAVSRVREVKLVEGGKESLDGQQRKDERSFGFHCRWTVAGTVEHWGHVHARTNEYEARFIVEPREGAWKITEMEVLGEKRVKFETRVRGL
jgi:hypothetical protein